MEKYISKAIEEEYFNVFYKQSMSKQERVEKRLTARLKEYMGGRFTLNQVYKQIINKTCPLPKNVRDMVLHHFEKRKQP